MQLSTDDMAIVFSEYLLPMCPIISQKYCYIGEPDTVLVSKAKKDQVTPESKPLFFPIHLVLQLPLLSQMVMASQFLHFISINHLFFPLMHL